MIKLASIAVAIMALSTPAFAATVCKSVPVSIDNNLNVATTYCELPTMNGGTFTDVSMSADCLPLSIAPTNPAEHIENRNRLVDSVTGVIASPEKSC